MPARRPSSAAGLVGLDINRAARIAAAAHGGQVVVSDAVRTLVTADLGDGVSLRGLGSHRLKDLREPEPLCQIVADGLRMEFPPLRSLDARPNNLPTQLTSFVGRERELAEAGALLEANRLVTLTGPGGTGKTRLSLQVAANAADRYPDGVFFVALETVREPTLVASRIASRDRARRDRRTARRTSSSANGSRDKQVLLVLDNFEQVVDAGPVIAEPAPRRPGPVRDRDLARRAPRLGRAGVPGAGPADAAGPERSSRAWSSRACPPRQRTIDAAALSAYESVRLFIARATSVRPDFRVTNENAPAVAAIAARLHGMPLAIELAAARIKLFSPDALRARLEDQLALLSAGARDLPERQQTLRGAIAWSYDLLDEGHRRLLDRLSVFEGGIDLAAAEAVCGPASELGIDVVDGLVALADQSLIRSRRDGAATRASRCSRRSARTPPSSSRRAASADAVADRHGAWFLALAQRIAPDLAGADQRRLLDQLELEHDNIRAVLDRATAAGDAPTAIGLAFAVWRFWQKRGHLLRGPAPPRRDGRRSPGRTTTRRSARGSWRRSAGVCWWQADIRAMRPAYEEAVEIWRGSATRASSRTRSTTTRSCSASRRIPRTPPSDSTRTGEGVAGLRTRRWRCTASSATSAARATSSGAWATTSTSARAPTRGSPSSGRRWRSSGASATGRWRRGRSTWSAARLLRVRKSDESRPYLREALRHFYVAGDAAGMTLVIDDLSAQALADDDPERAARLWGAAGRSPRRPARRSRRFTDGWIEQQVRPNVRIALDPADLERWAAEGAAMSLDEAVAYALDIAIDDLATARRAGTSTTPTAGAGRSRARFGRSR